MQAKDIKVGQILAMTRDQDPHTYPRSVKKVRVVEVSVEPHRRYIGSHVKGTTVEYVDAEDRRGWVPNRELKMPWDEFEAEWKRREEAKRQTRERRRAEQATRAAAARSLEIRLQRVGVEPTFHVPAAYEIYGWPEGSKSVFENLWAHIENGRPLLVRAKDIEDLLLDVEATRSAPGASL